jgi:hypothetical protein
MFRITLLFLLLIPSLLLAQQSKKETKKLKKEQEKALQSNDTLQMKLVEKQSQVTSEEERVQQMIEKYGKNKGRLVAAGKVWTSISPEMALDAWGEPLKKQKTELNNLITERWTYPDGRFLYFENGLLHSWRE